jgi:hypothetical protein
VEEEKKIVVEIARKFFILFFVMEAAWKNKV